MVKRNPSRPGLKVSADGQNVVGHAGARLLSDLADELRLTEALSVAMAPTKQRRRGHDRGQVLVDVATMIWDAWCAGRHRLVTARANRRDDAVDQRRSVLRDHAEGVAR